MSQTTMRLALTRPIAALALALSCNPTWADGNWDTVVRDGGRQVQIDRNSIIDSDRGTKVAWGRIVLAPSETAGRPYMAVQALNRYDCRNRSFYTVKRRYLDASNFVVNEESIANPEPIAVAPGTVDERLWREVCRPPTVRDLAQLAGEAERVAAAAAAGNGTASRAPVRAQPDPPATQGEPGGAADTRRPASRPDVPRPPSALTVANRPPAPVRVAAFPDAFAPPPLPPRRQETVPAAAPGAGAGQPPASATPPTPRATAPASRSADAAAPMQSSTAAPTRAAAPPVAADESGWSYAGATGPARWGRLRPEWAVCGRGTRQSPIDLRNGVAVDLEPVRFDYHTARFRIGDTGRTLKVAVGAGMGVNIRGRRYTLEHFQLHRPSEERVGGRAYDMSVHFHHRGEDGQMAIVAVLLEGGGTPHPVFETLWGSLPLERGGDYAPTAPIDLASLVPDSPAHFLYMGSLTTPPCTEGVLWAVMKEPVRVSDAQLDVFARLYPRNGRPIQPPNGRLILESR